MRYFYKKIRKVGNVVVSRHALKRMEALKISQRMLEEVLRKGVDIPDGIGIILRQKNNIRLVILKRPVPFSGAALIKTIYRVKPAKKL